MKKTYKESWFIMCQPASHMADALMSDKTYYNSNHHRYSDTEDSSFYEEIVVLQSEVQTKDYIMYEVMYKEDYDKYLIKDLKYIKNLEESLERAKASLEISDRVIEDLKGSIERTSDRYMRLWSALEKAKITVVNEFDGTISIVNNGGLTE